MNGDRKEVGGPVGQLLDQAAEPVRKQGLVTQLAAVSQFHHDQPPSIRSDQT
jgi:hypothetical protein